MKERELQVGEVFKHGDICVFDNGSRVAMPKIHFGKKVNPKNAMGFPHGYYFRPLNTYTSQLREKCRKYFPGADHASINNFIKSVVRLNSNK